MSNEPDPASACLSHSVPGSTHYPLLNFAFKLDPRFKIEYVTLGLVCLLSLYYHLPTCSLDSLDSSALDWGLLINGSVNILD